MRSTLLGGLSLLGLVSCTAASAQDSAVKAIEECVDRIERRQGEAAPGLKEIETQCPELRKVLERSPIAAWLPEEWWGPLLTTESLLQLRDHAAIESLDREARTLDTTGMLAALASLGEDAHDQVSWWDRLREWLRSRLQSDSPEPPRWLLKWLDELAEHRTALRIIGYCLFALIVLSAALIVLNELRAAGVFGASWRRQSRFADTLVSPGSAHALTLSDVERSDPINRPSLLLALLTAALATRDNRTVDASFTHRELAARVELHDDSQRSAFGRLLRCAERVRYAGTLPTRAEIDEAVTGGRRLLESLIAPPGTRPA